MTVSSSPSVGRGWRQWLRRHAAGWNVPHWPLWLAALGAVLFVASNAVVLLVLDPTTHPLTSQMSQQALLALLALLAPCLVTAVRQAPATDLAPPPWWHGAVWVLGTWAFLWALVQAVEAMSPTLKAAGVQFIRSLGLGRSVFDDIAAALSICLLAPLSEELLFRRLLFRSLHSGLQRWLPAWATLLIGVVVSSLLFADIHGGEGQDEQRVMLFVMGAVFCLTYVATRSIWVPILIHGLNNALALWQGLHATTDVTLAWPAQWVIYGTPLWLLLVLGVMSRVASRRLRASTAS